MPREHRSPPARICTTGLFRALVPPPRSFLPTTRRTADDIIKRPGGIGNAIRRSERRPAAITNMASIAHPTDELLYQRAGDGRLLVTKLLPAGHRGGRPRSGIARLGKRSVRQGAPRTVRSIAERTS